mmetsp:Transcript_2564/g.3171  ORF Transcript_2564/g.3171 Transcript_2564/m.3171 type:complete len:297 (-) Transcript_2564:172-1062(-)
MDDNKEHQEDGAASQTKTIVGDFDVLCGKDGCTNFVQHGEYQEPGGVEIRLHVEDKHTWIVIDVRSPVWMRVTIQVAPSVVVGQSSALVLPCRGTSCFWCCTTSNRRSNTAPNIANHGFRGVLANDIWRMNHVELLGGILACKSQDGQFTSWMFSQEGSHIKHLSVHHDPAVCLGVVFGHICQADAATTATTICSRHRSACSWFWCGIHLVLVRATGQLGALNCSCETSARHLAEIHILQVYTQHVLGSCLAGNTAENHAIQQRVAAQTVVSMHSSCNLTCCVQTRNWQIVGANAS